MKPKYTWHYPACHLWRSACLFLRLFTSGGSIQGQRIGMADDGSGILRIIPEDHVRIRNAHTDQSSGRNIKAISFRAFHRAGLDRGDLFIRLPRR